jgi:hypothetical protein
MSEPVAWIIEFNDYTTDMFCGWYCNGVWRTVPASLPAHALDDTPLSTEGDEMSGAGGEGVTDHREMMRKTLYALVDYRRALGEKQPSEAEAALRAALGEKK